MTESVLHFPNEEGEILHAILSSASIDNTCIPQPKKKALIILCHGLLAHCKWEFLPKLTQQLLDAHPNCDILGLDFSGNGNSQGEWEYGAYTKQVQDLKSAVKHLQGYEYDIQVLIGHSMGANVVLMYSSVYTDVPCTVNICGRFKMDRDPYSRFDAAQVANLQSVGEITWEVAGKELTVTAKSINEKLGIDMKDVSSNISQDIQVLTVHGEEDNVVPIEDADMFNKFIRSHTLVKISNAGHRFRGETSVALGKVILKWLANRVT